MKMPNWTDEQKNAINARGTNILVSAAAGSGKTAVLIERVVNMITKEQIPIDRLLIVTFTNAAATEMRSRLSKALSDIIRDNPNDTNAKRQLSLLPSAKICTIDSFCINLVRENFFNLEIERDFKIMDESERLTIEQNVLDEMLTEKYEQGNSRFLDLVELLSGSKNDKNLARVISNISNFVTSQAFPKLWLDRACELYNPDLALESSACVKYAFSEAKMLCNFAQELIDEAEDSLSFDDELFEKYNDMLLSDRRVFESIEISINSNNWNETMQRVNNASFSRMPSKRGYESPSKAIIEKNRSIYKTIVSKSIAPLFCADEDDYRNDCLMLYPLVKLLNELVLEFDQRVMTKKKELNSYTFSDIEHFAIELLFYADENGELHRKELANELEDSYYEILVDEYQDTNEAQDTLFKMLSNGKNRFMVGDIKQSIYRFRLAMPQIFSRKKESYAEYGSNKKSDSYKICLSNNFRSRKGICEFTNFVFSKVMSKAVGGIDYNFEEMLNYHAEFSPSDEPNATIALIQTPQDADADEYEAHQVAHIILDMVQSKKAKFGDFAILFRSVKNRMSVYTKVFAEYSIPTICNNKVNLFSNNEIIILINLLRTIDNPVQDIPLLSTLMSVFFGYNAEEIASARIEDREKSLYYSISKSSRFSRVIDDINRYREYSASMSVENLLRQIIGETSYLSVISAMGNAQQRMLNVMKLIDIAKRFDNGENIGLSAFIRYVDSIISNKFNVESAVLSHTDENAVSLMSVHQSKGLEFPICILAGAGHRYNTDDLKSSTMLNSDFGIGLKGYNSDKLYRYNTLQYSVIRDKNTYELMSENLRVLYVAITRAKEQFITVISDKNIEKKVDSVSKNITNGEISPVNVKSIKTDGDIILSCALLHKDAGVLREMCVDKINCDMNSNFNLNIVFPKYEIFEDKKKIEITQYSKELLCSIKEKLSYRYERLGLSSFASKRTASSLDEKENNFEHLTSTRPAFLNKGCLTPAQKGTAMHTFMQYCNYSSCVGDLEAEIERLVSMSYLDEEQAKSLDRQRLNSFFSSDFAKRMFASSEIFREIKVTSYVPVCELEDTSFTDKVLVQGIADCVFEENGELVLVDYKTDKVNSPEELLERYKNQLMFYKNAVSKTLKKPVKEVVLYSFSLNKECIYK